MEEIYKELEEVSTKMEKSYAHTQETFSKIHAGRATPHMLDGIMVSYYGSNSPLHQIAAISTPDARTLLIQPWEKNSIPAIEKAILDSQLALTPQNDGVLIRINIPPLTEERRKNLVKQVKNEGENGRIAIRNVRRDAKERLKKIQKEGISEDEIKKSERKLQEITDLYISKINNLLIQKEGAIMQI